MSVEREAFGDRERVLALAERLRWLFWLRLIAMAGIALSDVSTQLVGYTRSLGALPWIPVPLAVTYNLLFFFWLKRTRASRAPLYRVERSLHWQCYLQAMCDVAVLVLLAAVNGGIEYPLFYVLLLAVLLTGLLLPRGAVYVQANLGAALFAAMAYAEYRGWLTHQPFLAEAFQHQLYREPRAVAGICLSVTGMLNVTAFMVSNLARHLNRAEARTLRLLGGLRQQVREATGQLAVSSDGLQSGADDVTQVAGQIAATVQEIAHGASRQASQLEHLSQNLDHLADAARRVAEGSQETHQTSAEAVSSAERGRQAALEAIARMQEVARFFAQFEGDLDELRGQSREIADVASAIEHFAERTDLLALNAGIEAARAGEHGRGFAVVASEVKKLASSSSTSAERVAEMVTRIQSRIDSVATSTQAVAERMRRGQESVSTLQGVLDAMAGVIARTDGLAGTMEHLSRQQLETQREIARSAGEVASTAEQTAAGAEETAAAVEQQVASFADFRRSVQDLAALAVQLDQAVAGLSESQD